MSEARKCFAALYTAINSEDKYYPTYGSESKTAYNEYSNMVNEDSRQKLISLFSEYSKNSISLFNDHTASVNTFTSSVNNSISLIGVVTSSLNSYTQSNDTRWFEGYLLQH
mgnify:CR=1 FL=1